VKSGH